MTALVRPPCTTGEINGLCVFPCFAAPHSIIRYQRVLLQMTASGTARLQYGTASMRIGSTGTCFDHSNSYPRRKWGKYS